jgi:cellulose synthase (UDP-forming)
MMCWRLTRRTPLPVPEGLKVAVFVPTINEPVEMMRRTVLAAMRMNYAHETWLLDDGNRAEMRALAAALGCRYLARTENSHAKAGNLNNALKHCDADFIAIFDADHAPAPAFLDETLGFFSDPRVAFVQTPQDFYNLDSFQHRARRGGSMVWNEQALFFRVIQPGKDRMNAAFFCGSCAVIRRSALDDIGGFAIGTVTQNIHTSLKLHKRGWRSVYHARSLAFGLAPSTAIPFLKQRLRWGQGAMQVWRQEGVLFARGLSLGQRLSYLATMLAYFEGWQRGLFYLAPVIVLTTGVMPIAAVDPEFMLHFIPYYLLTFWAFEEVARGYGRSLLTEQYNMMRFAVFIAATFGFFLRKLRFIVTPKSMGATDATRRVLWPQYLVLALNAVAIPVGIGLYLNDAQLPLGALVVNVLWAAIAIGLAGTVVRFALWVSSFRRKEYRFPLPIPMRLVIGDGRTTVALATNVSSSGFRLVGTPARGLETGMRLEGELLLPTGRLPISATVRTLVAEDSEDEDAHSTVGCELHWSNDGDRDQLDMFLYGSDLQLRLHGIEERMHTPLENFGLWLYGVRRQPLLRAGQRWLPLLVRRAGSDVEAAIGFISAPDFANKARTLVAMRALPNNEALHAEELTPRGARGVLGQIVEESRVDTHAAPIYLYKLAA